MTKFIDRTNQIYGNWKIIERSSNEKSYTMWLCECKCGKRKVIRGTEIESSHARKDCGCSKTWIGKRFGRFLVIGKEGNKCFNNSFVNCVCDCGNKKSVWGTSLYNGCSKSCGCITKEKSEKRSLIKVMSYYKTHARKNKREFYLNEIEFKELIEKNCFYCNSKPENKVIIKNKKDYLYNGIDRVDNKKGYIKENCVSCCKNCNLMKREMSYDNWINHMKNILNYILFKEEQQNPATVGQGVI